MPENSPKTIKISGLDYTNRLRRLFGQGKDMLNLAHDGDLYDYPVKKKNAEDPGKVILDLSLLYADTPEDRKDLGRMACINGNIVMQEGDYIPLFTQEERMSRVAKRFRQADVLFFSGHHYGSNYYKDESHNYYSPGLSSRLTFTDTSVKSRFQCAPAFDLNSLYLSGGPFTNVKLIVYISCNTLRENILWLYQDLFPNAVVLGYHGRAPLGCSDDRLLRKFLRALPWYDKLSGFRGLLATDASAKEVKQMLIAAWTKAIHASNSRRSQPGYFREINGIWVGSYIDATLPKVLGEYQFVRTGEPTCDGSKSYRFYLDSGSDLEASIVGQLNEHVKKDKK